MATENEKKTREGNVQLHTFQSWGKKNVIGFETNGNTVVAVWCKLCASLTPLSILRRLLS